MILELLGLIVFYFLIDNFYLKRRHLPPGPTPLPFFGNLLGFRDNQLENSIQKWRKQYGDIMTIWLGTIPVVTVHDSATIYDAFVKDGETYAGRFNTKGNAVLHGGTFGIIQTEGQVWKEHRKFVMQVLRDFGLGKNLMQERILGEVTSMMADIKEDMKNGLCQIPLTEEIDRAIGSIINALTFGYRFGREKKEEFQKNKENIRKVIESAFNIWWLIIEKNVEIMRHMPFFSGVYKSMKNEYDTVAAFYLENIVEHRRKIDLDADQEPTDYVEAFLKKQHQLEQSGQIHTFTDKQLFGVISDLWLAGQETTATTLGWLCLYVIRHPKVQVQIHQELDTVIGSDRLVTLDDRSSLPYISAVIQENQRVCNMIPLNVFHTTTRDVQLHGYTIPRGTAILPQVSTVLQDDRYFDEPHLFKPERFLDGNGKVFTPPEFMPFGVGKRACLGESLAKMEMFLFTANFLNQFKLKPAGGKLPDDFRNVMGTVCYTPYKCELESRY